MSKNKMMNNEELNQVSGGVILESGHKCKNCGKEFSVGIPNNRKPWDPDGIGLMPTKEDLIKDWQHKNYCYDCLHDSKVKKEEPKLSGSLF